MKKNTILAAVLAATVSSASAQSESNDDAPLFFAEASVGYMNEIDSPYYVASIVTASSANTDIGIQLLYSSFDESLNTSLFSASLDVDFLAVGPVFQYTTIISENNYINYSFSGGFANYDLDLSATAGGVSASASDSETGYYLDGSISYERRLNQDWSFNTGVRLLHFGDVDLFGGIDSDFDAVYFGVEAGFVFKF